MDNVNYFMLPIVMKKYKHDFKAWLKLMSIKRKIKKTSPTYDTLMEIYDFLLILKDTYAYNMDMGLHLTAGSIPSDIYNGSIVYEEDTFRIIFLLSSKPNGVKIIDVELSKKNTKQKDRKTYKFIDGESYKFKDVYDEECVLFIVSNIMDSLYNLITYYYKRK